MGYLILNFLRGLAWCYWVQPRRAQLFWGKVLGLFLMQFRFRSKVALENLERAFPGQPDEQKTNFKASYLHLGRLIFEILLLFGSSPRNALLSRFTTRWMILKGRQHSDEARRQGRGIIFLASHVGNWEMMAVGGVSLADLNLMMVTKQLKPSWLHQAIESGRRACGVLATYEPRTLKDVLHHLKKKGAVGIVLDQYVGPPVGVRVPVFGTPVGTSMLIATLAKRTGATVLPVENYRNPDGTSVLEIHPPLDWESSDDPHYELALNTARYSQWIEKSIFRHPDQWLWTHRRFKGDLSPLGIDEWHKPRVRK